MNLWLKWQQSHDMIHIGAHFLCAARTPRPYAGRNIIDDRDFLCALFDASGNRVGEFRAVYNDNHIRLKLNGRVNRLINPFKNHRQPGKHRNNAHNRHVFQRKQAVQALRLHMIAADARPDRLVRQLRGQRLHQRAAKKIAGMLPGDKKNTLANAHRPLPYDASVAKSTPTRNSPSASACSNVRLRSAISVCPAATAIPASLAFLASSMVRGPMVGRSILLS